MKMYSEMIRKFCIGCALLFAPVLVMTAGIQAAENSDMANRVRDRLMAAYGTENDLARPKACKIHDRITVEIDDTIEAKLEAKSELSQDSTVDSNVSQMVFLGVDKSGNLMSTASEAAAAAQSDTANNKTLFKIPLLNSSGSVEHNGEGTTERNQTFKAEISGEVLDVLPNGHLIIEARRVSAVNDETETLVFTGRVDPKDLDEDSVINAKFVIDRAVHYEGKGEVTQSTRRGWLVKLYSIFRPL